jgi:hypothetical protein
VTILGHDEAHALKKKGKGGEYEDEEGTLQGMSRTEF